MISVAQCRGKLHHHFRTCEVRIADQNIQLATSHSTSLLCRAFQVRWVADVNLDDMNVLPLACKLIQWPSRLLASDECYDSSIRTGG